MIHSNAAFCQNFLKVTIGNRVTHVKEDCMQDDTFGKWVPLKATVIRIRLTQLCALTLT